MAGLRSVPERIAWSPWQIFSRLTSQFSLYRFGGIAYGKDKGNKNACILVFHNLQAYCMDKCNPRISMCINHTDQSYSAEIRAYYPIFCPSHTVED